jgi:MFS family permease
MPTPRSIQHIYLLLLLGNTLAASFIWGINTIFLLDAGLSNLEAFAANAAFTAGMVIFEVPTGIVADTVGRRASYLLGTLTLTASTLLYVLLWQVEAPFWQWAIVSLLLGLGFTFFSGAVEAWLVDALAATCFTGEMETVFGRGQMVTGAAMLGGSVAGGFVAQQTSLGVPFVLRGLILGVMFVVAFRLMHDIGFSPDKGGRPLAEMRKVATASIEHGWRVPAVKWLMVEALFAGGVGIYAFYALQPYLLELYGDPQAYQVAGLVAAIVAGAQILGGVAAPSIRRLFHRRTSALIASAALSVVTLGLIGSVENFWAVIGLTVIWGLMFAAARPIRQAYINGLIPSRQRATILSFDSLMASGGGVWTQPALGRAADLWGYAPSYLMSAGISAMALPFLARSRRQNAPADTAGAPSPEAAPQPA